mmetsp:Transcript_41431/g.107332  ORF Transcript_41431/g.107332 Transcript_41431/m.107332 type:complete len:145 (-) Transcript_41431:2022-2456(-)
MSASAAGLPWATGLLGLYDDFEVFVQGTLTCCCMCARNKVELEEGKPAFGMNPAPIVRGFKKMGCNERDAACCLNCTVCFFFPCIEVCWRSDVRRKYNIEGNLFFDCLAVVLCPHCSVMQSARELKRKKGSKYVQGVAMQNTMA